MKKLTLMAAFVFAAFFSHAQDVESDTGLEIGLKVSPAIATNRFQAPFRFNFENENAKLRGSFGLVLDYFFGKNYAFNTGLEYSVKGGKIKYTSSQATDTTAAVKTTDELNIQYLAVPLGIKLYTNEVATDTRVYFNLGTSLNFRISSKINGDNFYGQNNDEIKANKRYNFFEADAIIGAGAEWQLGTNTKFFGGLSYHRGLIDIDRYYEKALNEKDIAIRSNTFALDLGLKF
ncbi:porin family protein [Adhaeribacter terreus]|uniref:Porin family protein n=1 Tax=Adhaeribacter terreus TaxID=529703 RepID=A0ABW0EAC9_9BACT